MIRPDLWVASSARVVACVDVIQWHTRGRTFPSGDTRRQQPRGRRREQQFRAAHHAWRIGTPGYRTLAAATPTQDARCKMQRGQLATRPTGRQTRSRTLFSLLGQSGFRNRNRHATIGQRFQGFPRLGCLANLQSWRTRLDRNQTRHGCLAVKDRDDRTLLANKPQVVAQFCLQLGTQDFHDRSNTVKTGQVVKVSSTGLGRSLGCGDSACFGEHCNRQCYDDEVRGSTIATTGKRMASNARACLES